MGVFLRHSNAKIFLRNHTSLSVFRFSRLIIVSNCQDAMVTKCPFKTSLLPDRCNETSTAINYTSNNTSHKEQEWEAASRDCPYLVLLLTGYLQNHKENEDGVTD